MRFITGALLLAAAALNVGAQRPASATICDYYAARAFGSNTTQTQFQLMQHIVALAFGGRGSLTDAPSTSTGILNPGAFDNAVVNLRPWFDGSKATTNLNNQAVGINWLDGGGEGPLQAFINKTTDTIVMANTTNQYRLMTDFYTAFGFIFSCSGVRQFPKSAGASSGPINLAYVHKYMQLNSTHLGHFINQLTDASKYFGFSTTDADTLETFMNARYNVRCAPAVNGQLYSLCQADECPLAAPAPDCAAYANLGPTVNQTSGGGGGGGGAATPSPSGTPSPSSSPSATPAPAADNGNSLSAGAIAGIAIGAAAVLLIAVGLFIWNRRRNTKVVAVPYTGGPGGPGSPAYTANTHTSYTPSANPHHSYQHHSYMPSTPSEAGTYGFQPKPEDALAAGAYGYNGQPGSPPLGPQPMQQIAEMEGASGPWEVHHNPIPAVAAQDYAESGTTAAHDTTSNGLVSPGMVSQDGIVQNTVDPNNAYHSTSPHQPGVQDRRDHGPGASVW